MAVEGHRRHRLFSFLRNYMNIRQSRTFMSMGGPEGIPASHNCCVLSRTGVDLEGEGTIYDDEDTVRDLKLPSDPHRESTWCTHLWRPFT